MWSYFEVVGTAREFKYVGEFKLWWKPSKGTMDRDLKLLILDKDAIELANYAKQSRNKINIYVEHIINETQNIEFVEFIKGGTSGGVESEGVEIDEEGEVGVEGEAEEH